MEQTKTNPTKIPKSTGVQSQFFDLLSSANEIRVREVPSPAQTSLVTGAESLFEKFDDLKPNEEFRAFVVQVRRPTPRPSLTPSSYPERTELLAHASLLLSANEVLLARHVYSYLLKGDIKDKEALQGLGHCLLKLGESASAKKCFRAIWELYHVPECLVYLGACHFTDGEDDLAVDVFQKISDPLILSEQCRFEFYKTKGNCLTRLGELNEAKECYENALKLQPQSDVVYVNLGTIELQKKGNDRAAIPFQLAIQINPKNSRAHCGLGLAMAGTGNWTRAKICFETALDIDSQNLIAISQLWHLAQNTDDHSFIKPRLKKYLDIQPRSADCHYWLAACLYAEGKWSESGRAVDQALYFDKLHPLAQQLKEAILQNRHHQGAL